MDEKQAIRGKVIDYILELKENMNQDYIELTNLEVAEALAIYDAYETVYSAMKNQKLKGVDLGGTTTNNIHQIKKMKYYGNKNKKYNFRKIPASDELFIKMRNGNKATLEEFESFAALQTLQSGRAKGGTSGKAPSYRRYLVRLFIIANERTKMEMNSIEFFNELTFIKKDLNFPKYNSSERNFPGGTINSYLKYWITIAFEDDDIFDNSIFGVDTTSGSGPQTKQVKPKEKPERIIVNGKEVYARDAFITKYAKEKAKWLCEFDRTHITFISKYNGFPYVEAHHLIPMALQSNFNYSLDIPSNIISVCPNCHRIFHYGIDSDKEKMLQRIYQERKHELILAGVGISYKELLSFYT